MPEMGSNPGGGGAGDGTSIIDDTPFTPEVTRVTPVGGYYNSAGEPVDDGDVGDLAMTQRRALHATLRTPADDSVMDEANDSVRVTLVAGGGAGGTAQTDDDPFGVGVDDVTPVGYLADEVAPDSVDEGDIGAPRMSLNRVAYGIIRDAAGNERGLNIDAAGAAAVNDNGGSVTIDDGGLSITTDFGGVAQPVTDGGGSFTVDGTVAVSAIAGALPAGGNQIGDVVVNDVEDGAGDSIMDPANDAMRVNVVAGGAAPSEVDDSPFGIATDAVSPSGFLADEAGPDSVDEGDIGLARMSLNRVQLGIIRDAAGNERGANVTAGNRLEVAVGSFPADQPFDLNQVGGVAVSVNAGNVDAGTQRVVLATDQATLTADQATHDNLNANANLQVGDADVAVGNPVPVAGTVADDAPDSGNPVKIGGRAVETDGTDPGEVAEDDRADIRTDMNGRVLVATGHPFAWKTNNNYAAAQTDTEQKAAPGANKSLYITKFVGSGDAINTITLVSDTAGGPSTVELGPYYISANGGFGLSFDPPIRIAPNTNVGITSTEAENHTVTINGYTGP